MAERTFGLFATAKKCVRIVHFGNDSPYQFFNFLCHFLFYQKSHNDYYFQQRQAVPGRQYNCLSGT